MNSFVASLRRRFDKILTTPTNSNDSSSSQQSSTNTDDNFPTKISQRENKDKISTNVNVYDTLHKNRPFVRSNPNLHPNEKPESGSSDDNQTPHIYESLDTPTPDTSIKINPISASPSMSTRGIGNNDESIYISASSTPPIFKSAYIIPTSLVVLDHFTTNLYLVVNSHLNQLLVVFGSTKIHTIKLYDTDGRKLLPNDLRLQFKFEELHGYKLMLSALSNNIHNQIIVNEIRMYVSHNVDDIHNQPFATALGSVNNQSLKQRLLFFNDQGHFISASKRLPVNNELLFAEVDRQNGSIYAYDGYNLVNIDHNWSIVVENIDCIASGSNVLVCLHTKTNQISIYNSHTGSFIYRWLITSPNIRNLQSVHLCNSKHDLIYVLVWNCDVHPVNNVVLVFDQEGQLRREYYVPNRLISNMHGTYSYEMTLGGGSHHSQNQMQHLMRRPSRKFEIHPLTWLQQPPIWNNNAHHPQIWQNVGTTAGQFQAMHRAIGHPYDFIFQQQQQQQQQVQDDPTIFHPRFIAMTDDETLILSNIIDLGLDEETQETSMVNVSRKILFFHLET